MADIADLVDYTAGRVWDTDFSNPATDAANFTLINYVYVTDPETSLPAVQMDNTFFSSGSDGWAYSKILTQALLRHCDVLVRFRPSTGNTVAGHTADGRGFIHAGMQLGTQVWAGGMVYGEGSDYDGMIFNWASGRNGAIYGETAPLHAGTDRTSQRLIRVQKLQDAMRYKEWNEQDGEPTTWRYLTILSGGTDFAPEGYAGFFGVLLDNSFISHLTVTELLYTSTNLVHNSTFNLIDSLTGNPLWWTQDSFTGSTAVFGVESVTDWLGQTRNALKVASPPGSAAGAGLWQQSIYNPAVPGPVVGDASVHRWPQGDNFNPLVTVTVWSKGAGISEPGSNPFLGAAYVAYYYDKDGVLQSYNSRPYHHYVMPLGPANVIQPPDGSLAGGGTWGWYKTEYVMDFVSATRLHNSVMSFGVHDAAASGTVWIGSISIRAYDPAYTPDTTAGNGGTTLANTVANTGLTPGSSFAYEVEDANGVTVSGGLSATVLSRGEVRIPPLTLPDGSPAAVWLAQVGGSVVETLQIAPIVGTDGKALLSADAGNTAQLPDAPTGYGGGGLTTGQDETLTAVGAVLAGFGTVGQPGGIARAEDVQVNEVTFDVGAAPEIVFGVQGV